MSGRRYNFIEGRYAPSEEYRRKLGHRHKLENICLALSVIMIGLCTIYMLEIDHSMFVLRAIIIFGGILNFVLSIRLLMVRRWFFGVCLLLASAACIGGLAYLMMT